MPELPEVETIRRGAERYLRGLKITNINIQIPKIFSGDPGNIIGKKIIGLRRIAKILVIDFEPEKPPRLRSQTSEVKTGGYSLIIHLKLTGQLVYQDKKHRAVGGHPEKGYLGELPNKYTHIIYQLSNGGFLFYNDLRKFGWHKVVPTADVGTAVGKEFHGVDAASKEFTEAYLTELLKKRASRPVKEILMDQSRIAGLGNIYAAEALFYGGVRPIRKAGSLRPTEVKALYRGVKKAVDLGIKYGGSSPNYFVNIKGQQGHYMKSAQVYQQKTCKAGHPIETVKQGGRTSWYCPVHQR